MFNEKYINIINKTMNDHLNEFLKESPDIKQFCEYSLLNGKRIRPCITVDICNTCNILNENEDDYGYSNYTASLFVEYIHTASLIVDDLPCMDNAKTRRNNQCIHLKYGEAQAQITSITLLSLATNALFKNILIMKENNLTDEKNLYELNNYIMNEFSKMLYNTSHGQLMDLSLTDESTSTNLNDILKKKLENKNIDIVTIIKKKTGSFFEMSFILGWLIGKGDIHKIQKIKELSFNFSMIYQILDDIEDMEEDLILKKKKSQINYVLHFGMHKAIYDFKRYSLHFTLLLDELKLTSNFFTELINHINDKFEDITNMYKKT